MRIAPQIELDADQRSRVEAIVRSRKLLARLMNGRESCCRLPPAAATNLEKVKRARRSLDKRQSV